jgi:hypothetical protein
VIAVAARPPLRSPLRSLVAWASLLLALLVAAPLSAQLHPLPSGPRPLHARLAVADAAAIVNVLRVETGRIHVELGTALHGSLPGSFAVKRSPSRPPPLEAGSRALLFLRGARPPYVLVDRPEEVVLVEDAAAEQRMASAVRALVDAAGPAGWAETYVGWLDGDDERLRALAAAALADPKSALVPYSESVVAGRVAAALDPARPALVRRVSAGVAATRPEGVRALLAGLLAGPRPADVELLAATVRGAVAISAPDLSGTIVRMLRDTDTQMRRAGVTLLALAPDPGLRTELERVAHHDADPALREEAVRVLELLSNRS